MTRALFALLIVLAALAQATILPAAAPLAIVPNVVLVLILVRAALYGVADALIWILLAGVTLDVLALDPIGANGLALLAVALVAALARKRFFHNGMIFPMLLAMLATFAYAIVLAVVRAFAGEGMAPLQFVLRLTLLQALLNSLLVPPLYLGVGWLNRFGPEGAR
ncbi:MAG: rod shape-determining protein MreD [Thermomicrobiales bacterium]|nr:rod shape-determining protein MreD [Thermomicrobiales bacterium]